MYSQKHLRLPFEDYFQTVPDYPHMILGYILMGIAYRIGYMVYDLAYIILYDSYTLFRLI